MKNQSRQSTWKPTLAWLSIALLLVLVGFTRWSNVSQSSPQPSPQPNRQLNTHPNTQPAIPQNQAVQSTGKESIEVPQSNVAQNSVAQNGIAHESVKLPKIEANLAQKKKATKTPTPRPTRTPVSQQTPQPTRRPLPTATATRIHSQSGLPTILFDDLPPEAKETIRLIDQNGPFPFWKDDTEFQNRERKLPRKPRDYYREFTVVTPGEGDRGARRIIEGADGELYYTDDHYNSFKEVAR